MKYDKIVEAIFIERPNRFIARVKIDGSEEVESVHVKNTGRCRELLLPGAEVILEDCIEKNPNRKTRYDLVAVKKNKTWVNIDSQAPNKVVKEWLMKQKGVGRVDKKKRTRELIVFAVIVLALLAGCLLTPSGGESEPIQEVMRDAVLHEQNKVSLFGLIEVNPGLISAYIVTGILIVFALVCRLFVIPKFKYVPGRFQLVLEQIVGMFDGLAEGSSPHRNKFLRAYIFTAGVYIFVSTLFELLGIQVVTTSGHAVSLPAPLSDINGAIALGVMSYGVILFGGLIAAGVRGFLHALKDFSLPISMSFRLFGALLSGALVTELVYYYAALSYVLPVIVGVMFTLLHALIQAYVLTMLVSTFYGESTEKHEKKPKAKKVKKSRSETAA